MKLFTSMPSLLQCFGCSQYECLVAHRHAMRRPSQEWRLRSWGLLCIVRWTALPLHIDMTVQRIDNGQIFQWRHSDYAAICAVESGVARGEESEIVAIKVFTSAWLAAVWKQYRWFGPNSASTYLAMIECSGLYCRESRYRTPEYSRKWQT